MTLHEHPPSQQAGPFCSGKEHIVLSVTTKAKAEESGKNDVPFRTERNGLHIRSFPLFSSRLCVGSTLLVKCSTARIYPLLQKQSVSHQRSISARCSVAFISPELFCPIGFSTQANPSCGHCVDPTDSRPTAHSWRPAQRGCRRMSPRCAWRCRASIAPPVVFLVSRLCVTECPWQYAALGSRELFPFFYFFICSSSSDPCVCVSIAAALLSFSFSSRPACCSSPFGSSISRACGLC